jgi:hypothetical protein
MMQRGKHGEQPHGCCARRSERPLARLPCLIVAYFGYALILYAGSGFRYRYAGRWLGDHNIGASCRGWRTGISAFFARIDDGPSLVVSLKVWPIRTRRWKLGPSGGVNVGLRGKSGSSKKCSASEKG